MSLKIDSTYLSTVYPDSSNRFYLPNEIWKIIIHSLNGKACLKHLTSFALTSKEFFAMCLDMCTNFQIQNACYQLRFLNPAILEASSCNSFKFFALNEKAPTFFKCSLAERDLLAIDERGRHYSCSPCYNLQYYSHFLFIQNPATHTCIVLNLQKETEPFFKTIEGLDPQYCSIEAQQILSCFPIENGFIVVTWKGYSIWHYQNNQPTLQGFFTIFTTYNQDHGANMIRGASFKNGQLLLKTMPFVNKTTPDFYRVDTATKNVDPIALAEGLSSEASLMHMEGNSFLLDQVDGKIHILEVEIYETSSSTWEINKKGQPLTFKGERWAHTRAIDIPDWTLYINDRKGKDLLYILKHGELWMGEEFDLRAPQVRQKGDHYLIYEDFLFLSYTFGDVCVVYLPNKKKYQLKYEGLRDFLWSKRARLHRFTLENSKAVGWQLQIVFETFEEDESKLHVLTVPLANLKKEEETIAEGRRHSLHDPAPNAIPTGPTHTAENRQQTHLTNKITLVVGIILLFLVAITSATLFVLQPGMVIYQGNGITLTLPTILTLSIGAIAALIPIVIGSYRLWKQR